MKINQHHGSYNISKRLGKVQYIVCHYTGSGTSKAGSALANCKYFAGGNRNASAHYFIDDSGIWEYADPSKYYTWHCGDGKGKYGITNANSIGIEVCLDGDKPYTEKEIGYLKELVLYLMDKFDVPASRVVMHWTASRKMCPLYYAKRPKEWDKLHERITKGASMGWVKDSKGWWYKRADGSYPKNEWEKIGGEWYYFNPDGYMRTGWLKYKNQWYYLDDPSGKMAYSTFRNVGGKWYGFRKNGVMVTSEDQLKIDGKGAIAL